MSHGALSLIRIAILFDQTNTDTWQTFEAHNVRRMVQGQYFGIGL